MSRHFILDFETLGQDVFHIPMLDCSYLAFDWDRFTSDNPYTIEELIDLAQKDKIDIVSQVKEYGAKYKQRDVDWWMSQSEDAKKVLKPSETDVRVEVFIDNIINYIRGIGNIDYWWSRSNTFDPIILVRYARLVGREEEISDMLKFWKIRDTRTFIDAKLNFPKDNSFVPIKDVDLWNEKFKKHDSSWDISADVLRMQAISRAENDMEQA